MVSSELNLNIMNKNSVWVFCGEKSTFPSAVFSNKDAAHRWIVSYGLSGTLTEYPVDQPVYEWAIVNGYFKVGALKHESAEFIQKFSSASQEHYHYINGQT